MSYLTHLECSACGRRLHPDRPWQLCPDCDHPLLARYDLGQLDRWALRDDLDRRPPGLWRYRDLLPLRAPERAVSLGESATPLLRVPRLAERMGVPGLLVKDEGALPTGTFKARGAAVGASRAVELGVRTLALPTAGNAGAAWAAYGARAGLEVVVVMPETTPSVIQRSTAACGADLYLVPGSIADAGAVVREGCQRYGWYDASTLKEPYRVEGKKTMGFELADQLGWRLPDVIVYPTGGGVGLIGMWKGFQELAALGWLPARGTLPRFVAAQAAGCAPVVRAFAERAERTVAWEEPATFAAGLRVPKPLGDLLILLALRETGGTAVAIPDETIAATMELASAAEGVLLCPEGAAALAAAAELRRDGWIGEDETVAVFNTGTGLLYEDSLPGRAPRRLRAGEPLALARVSTNPTGPPEGPTGAPAIVWTRRREGVGEEGCGMATSTGDSTTAVTGRHSLEPLIRPASIAVIGASSTPTKAGHQLMRALDGFAGRLYPVNPGAAEILGHTAYPSIGEVPEPVDLAVLVVPAAAVPEVVGQCAAAGARAAIVCAGGFAEAGPDGAGLQERAVRTAAAAGMRLLGPNTSGLVNPVDGVRATFLSTVRGIPPGRLAIVAQSGGVNLAVAMAAAAEGLGVRLAIGLGNAADVGHAELLDYLAGDPETGAIALHLEGAGDGRGLVEAVERAVAAKPVVALVLGESDVGDFARSHTGTLATSWRLTRAALRQAGAVVVDDTTELLDAARALRLVRLAPAASPGVGVVTGQAGPGLLVTDRLRAHRVRVPELDAATSRRLGELLPPVTYQRNPVDTGRPDERFGEVVAAVQGDPGIDAALVYALHEPGALDPVDLLRPAAANPSTPLLLVTGGPREEVDRLREAVEAGGVPVLTGPERGATAMRALVADAVAAFRLASGGGRQPVLAGAPLVGPLDEDQAKRVLEAAGLRTPRRRVCGSREQARAAAAELGPAVVVKVLDAAITHKTEVGGVHVGVEAGPAMEAALDAIDRLAAPGAARYLVEELLPPGVDLIVGGVRDPSFGPAVLVGLGGVVAEALGDTAVRLAPLSAGDGHEMLAELRGHKLLDGFRGGPRVDRDELVRVLRSMGELLIAHPEIAELDVNPLRATGDGLIAADALMVVDQR